MLRHSAASLLAPCTVPQRVLDAQLLSRCSSAQLKLLAGSARTSSLLGRLLSSSDSSSSSSSNSNSNSSSDNNSTEKPELPFAEEFPPYDVTYTGSFNTAHTMLKRASLLNTFASVAASPLVLMYAEMGVVGRVGLAVTLSGFGLLTTGALHWFTKPYVHQLDYSGSTGDIEVKSVDILSRLRSHRFHVNEVTFSTALHPAVTFMAKGKPYFIEKNIFPDEHLLQYLTPEDPALANAPRIKDDEDD